MITYQFITSLTQRRPTLRTFGIEQYFTMPSGSSCVRLSLGVYFTNSDNKVVQVRDVAEDHVLQDLGTIPSLADCMRNLPLETRFGGDKKRKGATKLWIQVD